MGYEVVDANTLFGFYSKRKVDSSKEALVQELKRHGVKKALTLSMKGIYYDHVLGNAETLQTCAGEAMLLPVATVDPRKYYGGKNELRSLVETGFKAFRLFPDLQGWPLDYAPFLKFLEEAREACKPLLFPAYTAGFITKAAKLTENHGFPVVFTSVGYWTISEAIAAMREAAHVYVETHLLDSPDAIEVLTREVGAERLIFGSNMPLSYFSVAYLPIVNAEVSEEAKAMILGGNLLKLLEERG